MTVNTHKTVRRIVVEIAKTAEENKKSYFIGGGLALIFLVER